jgi:hypothetical protein
VSSAERTLNHNLRTHAASILGRSSDGSGRAVFSVVVADGSIVQEHTAKALDGLAPKGTVGPLLGQGRDDMSMTTAVYRLGSVQS